MVGRVDTRGEVDSQGEWFVWWGDLGGWWLRWFEAVLERKVSWKKTMKERLKSESY